MAKSKEDKYLQFASVYVSEVGVSGSGGYTQFTTGQTIRDRVGIEISIMEVLFQVADLTLILGDQDFIEGGLTVLLNGVPTAAAPYPNGKIAGERLSALAAPTGNPYRLPLIRIFDPPILAHPAALYGYCLSNSLAAVAHCWVRVGFRYIELSEEQYADILQTTIAQNVL